MTIRAQFRRGTVAEWDSVNPILFIGEIGYATDASRFKIGDGVKNWRDLPFVSAGGAGTLTSITAGKGLIGGKITTSGTIAVDESIVMTLDTPQNIYNKTFKSPSEVVNRMSHTGGVLNIDVNLANDHYIYLTGNITNINFENIDHNGKMVYIRLLFESTNIHTVNWPPNVMWPNSQQPMLSGGGRIDIIGLMTFDDGVNFFGKKESSNLSV